MCGSVAKMWRGVHSGEAEAAWALLPWALRKHKHPRVSVRDLK